MQRHRVYEGIPQKEHDSVDWSFVDSESYVQGYDIALNDGRVCKIFCLYSSFLGEWMVSFSQHVNHGTSNVPHAEVTEMPGYQSYKVAV